MKFWMIALALTLTTAAPLTTFAKEKSTREVANESADDSDSEECNDLSTNGMLDCAYRPLVVIRKNIAGVLLKIRKDMRKNGEEPKELVSRLFKMNKAYKAYIAAECSMRSAEMLNGSGERLIFAGCYTDMMKKHLVNLEELSKTYGVQSY